MEICVPSRADRRIDSITSRTWKASLPDARSSPPSWRALTMSSRPSPRWFETYGELEETSCQAASGYSENSTTSPSRKRKKSMKSHW